MDGRGSIRRKEADLIGRLLAGGEDLFRDLLNPRLARPLKRVVHAKIGNKLGPRRWGSPNGSESVPAPGAVSEQDSFPHVALQIMIHEAPQRRRLRWSSRLVPLDQPARSRGPRSASKPPRRSSGLNGVGITDAARLLGITVRAAKTRDHGARLKQWPTHWQPLLHKRAPLGT